MVQFTRLSPILLAIGYDFSDYIIGGLAQLARAPALHAGGQRFESVILHFFQDDRLASYEVSRSFLYPAPSCPLYLLFRVR